MCAPNFGSSLRMAFVHLDRPGPAGSAPDHGSRPVCCVPFNGVRSLGDERPQVPGSVCRMVLAHSGWFQMPSFKFALVIRWDAISGSGGTMTEQLNVMDILRRHRFLRLPASLMAGHPGLWPLSSYTLVKKRVVAAMWRRSWKWWRLITTAVGRRRRVADVGYEICPFRSLYFHLGLLKVGRGSCGFQG
jgi:hypothetical protein